MNNQDQNKPLILLDLDGTLAKFPDGEILPGVREYFAANKDNHRYAICSNAGGVGLRFWQESEGFGEPTRFPTEIQARKHILEALREIDCEMCIYMCFAYQSKQTGIWSPIPAGQENNPEWGMAWRKPKPGMLLAALDYYQCAPADALFVGDWQEDREAAKAAGVPYIHADDFFKRR